MRILSGLSFSAVKTMGLRKLRDSYDPDATYNLCRVGDSGELELLTDAEYHEAYSDSILSSWVGRDGFLRVGGSAVDVLSEDAESYTVSDKDGIVFQVPKDSVSVESEAVRPSSSRRSPAYRLDVPQSLTVLQNPPYASMDRGVWGRALGQVSGGSVGVSIHPGRVMFRYRFLMKNR